MTGFAARVRVGGYGRRQQIKADTVLTAIAAVGKEIALASGINPTKMKHTEILIFHMDPTNSIVCCVDKEEFHWVFGVLRG
jgi:hypothetical protein